MFWLACYVQMGRESFNFVTNEKGGITVKPNEHCSSLNSLFRRN